MLLLGVATGAVVVPLLPKIEIQAAGTFYITEETIVNFRLNRDALKAAGFMLLPYQRMWVRYA